jgi:hypothetical protein
VLTQDAAGTIEVVRRLFTKQRTGLLTFSAVAGVWATGRGFASVIRALNVAYDVVEDRTWIRRQAIAVALSLGTVAMTAVMVTMIVVAPAGRRRVGCGCARSRRPLRRGMGLVARAGRAHRAGRLVGDRLSRRAQARRPLAARPGGRRPHRAVVAADRLRARDCADQK